VQDHSEGGNAVFHLWGGGVKKISLNRMEKGKDKRQKQGPLSDFCVGDG